MKFTALADFGDEDLRSIYAKGCSYTVRPGNDLLAGKVAGWAAQGLVSIEGETTPSAAQSATKARIRGAGSVK